MFTNKTQVIIPVYKMLHLLQLIMLFFVSVAGAKEFFDYVKCERAKEVEQVVRMYSAIPQLLIEVERRVASTNSGKSPKLASYYAYWENRIYQVLTQLIVK